MKFPETARSMWTSYGGYHREFMPGFRQNIIHEIKKTTLHQHRAAPIGCIHGPISPFRSQIVRDDQGKVYKIGDQATFIIVPRDANGQFIFQKKVPEKQPFVVKIYPEVHKITVYPCLNAAKKLFVKVDVNLLEEGEFNVQVILNWYGIISKPFPITVDGFDRSLIAFIDEDREQEVKNQPDIVSGHGHGDDQVNRAWGVCALPGGLFAVGDRGNHQVKVFTTRGEIVDIYPPRMTPGVPMPPSTERGLFDKPCGLAYTRTPESAIVVADKDNHRVAILLWDKKRNKLKYDRAFGKEGTKIGQFKYPWDVSVNLSGEIAVSDSRNWRVQLFTFLGDYIASFGYGNEPEHLKASVFTSSRPLNYPRGIVFDKKGNLLVTDFNAHTVTIIDPEFKKSMQFGCSQKAANGCPSPPSVSPPSFSPPHRDDLDWSTLDISDNDSSSEEEQQQTSSAFMHYFDLNKDEEIDHVIMERNGFRSSEEIKNKIAISSQIRPAGVAIDRDGNFYVAVCKFRKIYIFNPDRTLRGKIINENLRKPAGICITTEGRLVVVEEGENDRISTVEDQHRILIF